MITHHQYLTKYPIRKDSKKLILGTIHPHDHQKFAIPFFYGNVNSIWSILSDAFPTELEKPLTLDNIKIFLERHKISVSDTIVSCERVKPTAQDSDLKVIQLNKLLISQIKNSQVLEIFFTSGFGKNNAFKLFYEDLLGLKITKEIKEKREVILPQEIFGRPVKLTVLLSPSGSANVPISKMKAFLDMKHLYTSPTPVKDFRIDDYRKRFSR